MVIDRGPIAFRNRSVSQSHFAMVPRADIPRSRFQWDFTHKTTFDAGGLVPLLVEEVLPGDSFNVSMTAFCRMATPVFPVMDNFHLDTFFFFVPNRLVWSNWVKMMGERTDPDDSIDYTTPQASFTAAPTVGSIYDYMGIPTAGQVTDTPFTVNALPIRAYMLIWNEWFRDQNLQTSAPVDTGDGPDVHVGNLTPTAFGRGKRHDYFTGALPWPQKGDAVTLPLGTSAPVLGTGTAPTFTSGTLGAADELMNASGDITLASNDGEVNWANPELYADLSTATAATINAIRQAFQVQRLLERDARGGTRYTELLLAHFGVQPQDSRLQRPEYLGGGSSLITVNPIAQQSSTDSEPTPLGSLGATAAGVARHGFSGAFTEHGFIIGLVNVRADLTYQQGLHKMWSRETRYDYYWPVFAHLGEQAVLRKEIYFTGDAGSDDTVFGYQERWAEYRYHPSMITSIFRSSAAGNIDEWHAAQYFATAPVLGSTFIRDNPPMERILSAGELAAGQEFLMDALFSVRATRPMPTYSVPGFIDRF